MKITNNKKQKLTGKPSCSNCFVCQKDTIFCSISPNYDREKAYELLQSRIKEAKVRE